MEPHRKVNPPNFARCPHCGNLVRHQIKCREDYSEAYDVTEDGEPMWDERWWAILQCTTCGKLSLYSDYWDESRKKWVGQLTYPFSNFAPEEVPENIRDIYDEAFSVVKLAPNLAAVGIRRCLEAIASNQNAQGGNLAKKIRYLGQENSIPSVLVDIMDTSRLLGNIGAHANDKNVTQDDVLILIEFLRVLFEYIYIAPARLKALRESLIKRGFIKESDFPRYS